MYTPGTGKITSAIEAPSIFRFNISNALAVCALSSEVENGWCVKANIGMWREWAKSATSRADNPVIIGRKVIGIDHTTKPTAHSMIPVPVPVST